MRRKWLLGICMVSMVTGCVVAGHQARAAYDGYYDDSIGYFDEYGSYLDVFEAVFEGNSGD